jgi:hypothetical protein
MPAKAIQLAVTIHKSYHLAVFSNTVFVTQISPFVFQSRVRITSSRLLTLN